jgi:hypothetical protein
MGHHSEIAIQSAIFYNRTATAYLKLRLLHHRLPDLPLIRSIGALESLSTSLNCTSQLWVILTVSFFDHT